MSAMARRSFWKIRCCEPSRQSPASGQAKQPNLPINWLPKHPFTMATWPARCGEGARFGSGERTIRKIGRQFACSEYIDQQIGRVLAKLKAMGELDNTYIITRRPRHGHRPARTAGEQNLYEHTWRVPFVVKGPGIKPGSRAQGNVYLLDTLATLCSLAGIQPPATTQGISLEPVLKGRTQTASRDVVRRLQRRHQAGMRSVRHGDWKLIKYDAMDGSVRKTQLFNLKENPHEFFVNTTRYEPFPSHPPWRSISPKAPLLQNAKNWKRCCCGR